jgi:hypothetical protein
MKIAISITAILLALHLPVFPQDAPPPPPRPPLVVVIGIDALSTEGLQFSNTPNIDTLIRRGALSLTTRGVMPTVSAPNWGSMLLGAGPEQHGITKNGWTKETSTIAPAERDADGYFPSIFKVVREQLPKSRTAMFYDWDELANFYNPRDITASVFSKDYHETVKKAAAYILSDRPAFTFIYIGHVDDVGHESGHGTEAYRTALSEVDDAIGGLFAGLKNGGVFDSTLFFVISDHGGVGHGHGGESMDEIEVPWIVAGPGTIVDRVLQKPNNAFNTASTVAWALGLPQPDGWIGRPVLEAFEAAPAGASYIPRPRISVAGGVYLEPQKVSILTKEEDVPIRYTLDGSAPGIGSPVYRDPIAITGPTVVRAVTVDRRGLSSVTTSEIVVVQGVKSLSLASAPAEKYSAGGALALVDGRKGTDRFNDGRWLGFDGKDLDLMFDFGDARTCSTLTVGCMNDSASWVFLPAAAELYASPDGRDFRPVRQLTSDLMKMRPSVKGAQSFTVSFEGFKDRWLRVVVRNIGVCPPGHSAAGKNAWLFIDEVTIK